MLPLDKYRHPTPHCQLSCGGVGTRVGWSFFSFVEHSSLVCSDGGNVLDRSGPCLFWTFITMWTSLSTDHVMPHKYASFRLISTGPQPFWSVHLISAGFTTQMLQPLMPIMRKVKYLEWFCCVFRRNDMGTISCLLDSLKSCESMEEIKWHFWTFSSDIMPSLERFIVHYYQSSYSVKFEPIYRCIGQQQIVLNEYKIHKGGLRDTVRMGLKIFTASRKSMK